MPYGLLLDILAFVTVGSCMLWMFLRSIGNYSIYPSRAPRLLESARLVNQIYNNLNNEIDSSPIQRLGVFFLGLLTFAGFGFLAWIAFNFSGGDNDENYEMRSAERAVKINEIISTQANGVIPTDDQLANYVSSNQEAEPKASQKPVPGTKAFDEWMKAQTAATQAKENEKTPEVKPVPEPEKEEKIVELTINALGDPPGTMKFKEVAV